MINLLMSPSIPDKSGWSFLGGFWQRLCSAGGMSCSGARGVLEVTEHQQWPFQVPPHTTHMCAPSWLRASGSQNAGLTEIPFPCQVCSFCVWALIAWICLQDLLEVGISTRVQQKPLCLHSLCGSSVSAIAMPWVF